MTASPWHAPRLIMALALVSGATLLMAVLSFWQAWSRPVTAISGIPERSEIIWVVSGKIHRAPFAPYATPNGLQRGDVILQFDGMPWAQAQRLNYHELPTRKVGDSISLVVQRAGAEVAVQISVRRPDAWEQLVLWRFAISALICWLPAALVLRTLARDIRRGTGEQTLSLDRSGIPLWVLTWLGLSLGYSVGSLKYPVAYLGTDILLHSTPLLVATVSLPYPLAPANKRPRFLARLLPLAALLLTVLLVGHALQSPHPSDDWRRAVQLLRPTDQLWWLAQGFVLLGISIGVVGIFTTGLSRPISALLQRGSKLPWAAFQRLCNRLAQSFARIYGSCPPGVIVIAQFQLMIIGLYLLFDMLPRMLGLQGGGYSVLLATIPFSYLLLYGDLRAQAYGQRWIQAVIVAVVLIQLPNYVYRSATGSFGAGANMGDLLTIFLAGIGSIVVGIIITLDQLRRRHRQPDPVQATIDGLFTCHTQAALWQHLVEQVGPSVGVATWAWLARGEQGRWATLASTPCMRPQWLRDTHVLVTLQQQLVPYTLTVVTGELPTTLIVLPLYQSDTAHEALIAVNPECIDDGIQLIDNPALATRMGNAVRALRLVEQQRRLAEEQLEQQRRIAQQQQQLAADKQRYADALQRLERRQRNATRNSNTLLGLMLHDEALQRLDNVIQVLRTHHEHEQEVERNAFLKRVIDQCLAVDDDIRRVLHDLRPLAEGQRVSDVLDGMVSTWERTYPTVTFDYIVHCDDRGLSEFQRRSVLEIVRQAVENALEHAQASRIVVMLEQKGHDLIASVEDDGRGFVYDANHVSLNQLGLLLMRDLAEEMGGQLTITTRSGAGCRVVLVLQGVLAIHGASRTNGRGAVRTAE
jgi:signal transduction histidine kinase